MRTRAAALALLVAVCGCTGGKVRADRSNSPATAPRSLPPPVEIRDTPDNVTLGDPKFTALPGARAEYGRLGGTVYQLETPEHWNGKLVLFMHGFGELASEARVSAPSIRRYLIGQGYAWGASSFSSTSLIPGRAADETAALWDRFAGEHGRPARTYVTGVSMGGVATNIAAERYGNRFDGALALCGAATQTSALDITTNLVIVGAWIAGITQSDYDNATDIGKLIRDRIQPALRDPDSHDRFETAMIQLTGGPRPFDREGFEAEEPTNWHRGELNLTAHLADNRATRYPDATLDRAAIRLQSNEQARRMFLAGNETTGDLQMPLLTMHTTGDGQVPIDQAQIYQREVDRAGKGDLMVQRVIRDPGHCGFNDEEWAGGLEALVDWVEHGNKPAGTNVMVDDLMHLDHTYERAPRAGLPGPQIAVPGERDRAVLRGAATLDGRPFDARYTGAVVVGADGLVTACQLTLPRITGGRYEISVLAEPEGAGCGAPGARVVLWTFANDRIIHSGDAVPWPGNGKTATTDIGFSSAAPDGVRPPVTQFSGEVFRTDGQSVRGGTKVEAYVGETLCGIASTRYTGSFTGYILSVVGPDSIAACREDAPLRLLIDGLPAKESAVNDLGGHESFDLTAT